MREKMIKSKERAMKERGITIVALVVTIVVLIILATISISALFGENGIVQKAKEAKERQANSVLEQETEMDKLVAEYANVMAESEIPIWGYGTYDRETQTVTNGKITLKIGDYVNYDHKTGATVSSYTSYQAQNGNRDQTFNVVDYNYGWRVLGVNDDGQLLLIAEDFVPLTGGNTNSTSGRTQFYLGKTSDVSLAQAAYVNGTSDLDNICEIYGQGYGALEARSVKVEDINKITGYNPTVTGTGKPYGSETIKEYGNEVTYTLTGGKIYYQGTKYPTTLESYGITTFIYYTGKEWKKLANEESSTALKSTYYRYYPYSLTTDSSISGTLAGISTDSTAYKMLFTNSSTGAYAEGKNTTDQFNYWLADTEISTEIGIVGLGVRYVSGGEVGAGHLYGSWNEAVNVFALGVRPVVTLSSTVQLVDSGTTRDGCALYNIY